MLVKIKETREIDITSEEAFSILCKTLNMDFVLDEDINVEIRDDNDGYGKKVYKQWTNGIYHLYDDRGDLFVALRNVAVNMFPNLLYRSADYIYKN